MLLMFILHNIEKEDDMNNGHSRRDAARQSQPFIPGHLRRLWPSLFRHHRKYNRYQFVMIRSPHNRRDLKHSIEYHTDWTPFDLVEIQCQKQRRESSSAAICLFRYVGPKSIRTHLTRNFYDALGRVGRVRPIRRPLSRA